MESINVEIVVSSGVVAADLKNNGQKLNIAEAANIVKSGVVVNNNAISPEKINETTNSAETLVLENENTSGDLLDGLKADNLPQNRVVSNNDPTATLSAERGAWTRLGFGKSLGTDSDERGEVRHGNKSLVVNNDNIASNIFQVLETGDLGVVSANDVKSTVDTEKVGENVPGLLVSASAERRKNTVAVASFAGGNNQISVDVVNAFSGFEITALTNSNTTTIAGRACTTSEFLERRVTKTTNGENISANTGGRNGNQTARTINNLGTDGLIIPLDVSTVGFGSAVLFLGLVITVIAFVMLVVLLVLLVMMMGTMAVAIAFAGGLAGGFARGFAARRGR